MFNIEVSIACRRSLPVPTAAAEEPHFLASSDTRVDKPNVFTISHTCMSVVYIHASPRRIPSRYLPAEFVKFLLDKLPRIH